jgi:L-lysine exporter family protein LysE/ArgO
MAEIVRNILLGISLAAPIGPSGVAVIRGGLQRGFLHAFITGLGVTLADTTYLLVVFFGLARFMTIPWVKVAIWSLGALILFYLGAQSLRQAQQAVDFEAAAPPAGRGPLLVGYFVNISNPIAVVWWVGIFGSLLGAAAGRTQVETLLVSATILVGILSWHTSVSLLTHWGRRFLSRRATQAVALLAGSALLLFGARFAFQALATLLGWAGY